jgi:uncharacterized protein YybS (DUF2232 family)
MENYNQQPVREAKRGWPVLLASILAALVALFIPAGLCAAPALWAFAGARTKPHWIALPAAVYTAGAFSMYSPVTAAGFAVSASLAAGLIYILLTRRVSNAYTALTLAGVFLAGLYAAVCLPGILDGRGAFTDIQTAVGAQADSYRSFIAQMPYTDPRVAAYFSDKFDELYQAVPSLVVSALCIFAAVLSMSNLLLFRLLCKKHPEIAISPMRKFRDWSLPRSMTLGLFVLLIGSLVLEWTGWAYAEGLSNTANALVGMPFLLQGLCVLDFLISRLKKRVALTRTMSYIGIGLLFSLAQMPLIIIGCFEQLFRFRDRVRGVPPRAAI